MENQSRIDILFWMVRAMAVVTVCFMVGCAGGAPQGGQQDHAAKPRSGNATLDLHPEGGSGVSGSASFEDGSAGVVFKLDVRDLPKPDTLYLAHIHRGTCATDDEATEHGGGAHGEEGHANQHGEESGHEHGGGSGSEHGGGIEHPLLLVNSDSEGSGSSTTMLPEPSVEELFSGEPKYVNVHEPGAGNPPTLACATLKQAG